MRLIILDTGQITDDVISLFLPGSKQFVVFPECFHFTDRSLFTVASRVGPNLVSLLIPECAKITGTMDQS